MSTKLVINCCYGGFGLSLSAAKWLAERGYEEAVEWMGEGEFDWDFCPMGPRHDPLLVACVEDLGEQANGKYGRLSIETIESDRYIIEEDEGFETIKEPKDIRWIRV